MTLEQIAQEYPRTAAIATPIARVAAAPFSGLTHMLEDSYEALNNGLQPFREKVKFGLTLAATAPVYTVTHELMHGLTAKMMGAIDVEFGLSPLLGGNILQKVWTTLRTDAEFIEDKFGGHFQYSIHSYDLTQFKEIAITGAPYILTFVGAYLLQQGIKKNNTVLKALGIANIIHLFANVDPGSDIAKLAEQCIPGQGQYTEIAQAGLSFALATTLYAGATKVAEGIESVKNGLRKSKREVINVDLSSPTHV